IGGSSANRATTLRARGEVTLGRAGHSATIAGDDLFVQSAERSVTLLGDTLLTGGRQDGQYRLLAAGNLTGGTLDAGGVAGFGIGDSIAVTSLSAGALATLDEGGAVVRTNALNVAGSIAIPGTLRLSNGDANLVAPRGIGVGRVELAAGRSANFQAANGATRLGFAGTSPLGTPANIGLTGLIVSAGNLMATQSILLTATDGGIDAGALSAGGQVSLSATGNIVATSLAGGGIDATAGGTANLGPLTAGDDVRVTSGGDLRIATATTTGLGTDSGAPGSSIVLATNGGALTTGDLNAAGDIGLTTRSPGAIDTGTLVAGGSIAVNSAGALTLAGARGGGAVALTAGGAIDAGPVEAGSDINLSARDAITADSLRAGGTVNTLSGSSISANNVATRGDLFLLLDGPIAFGTVDAGGSVNATSTRASVTIDRATVVRDLQLRAGGGVGGTIGLGTARVDGFIDLEATGNVTRFADIVGRGDIQIDTGGSVTAGNVTATAGEIDIEAIGGVSGNLFSAGHELTITSATGGVTLASGMAGTLPAPVTAENRRSIGIRAIGDVRVGAATAARDIGLASSGTVSTHTIAAGGNVVLLAGNEVRLGTVDAGELFYVANASMLETLGPDYDPALLAGVVPAPTGGAVTATGAIKAGRVVVASGGPFGFTTIDSVDLVQLGGNGISGQRIGAGGATTLRGASIAVETVESGGELGVVSTSGAITIDRARSGANATLAAAGTLTVASDIQAVGLVNARGSAVALNGRGPLTVGTVTASNGGVAVETAGTLIVGAAQASGSIRLTSTGGSVIVQDASNRLLSGSAVTADPVGATGRGDIIVNAAIDARLNGAVSARDDVNATAGQVIGIAGQVTGTNIALASADVAVGATAVLGGGSNSSGIAFTNNRAGSRTFIGDAGGTDGYRLDNAEFSRIRAQTIRFAAPGSATIGEMPDVVIGDLSVAGSATGSTTRSANLFGSNAALSVSTPGTLRIAGKLLVGSAGAGDRVQIDAGPRLDMITPAGALAITDASGAPTGQLSLAANQIVAAGSQAAADLATLATVDAKDERLGRNDGAATPDGFIRAGGITFRVASGLYIQNSGTGILPAERAGFTAGNGGVSIITAGTIPAEIVINGRQVGTGGTVTTGRALIPLLTLRSVQGEARLDARSTANGCLIVGTSCVGDLATRPLPMNIAASVPPVQDVLGEYEQDSAVDGGADALRAFNVPIIELVDLDPYGFAPSIDDPVTGAGNDDLWTDDCTNPANAGDCPPGSDGTPGIGG
ncbi:MAG: putative outer rane autotransporter, partial [Sphingomonas bacterium]|nr:putative outer rane autotransporter [Sphingomonas bacterium]